MRLRCTKGMFAHWGSIFEEGKEYDVIEIVERKVEFITDYEKYYEKVGLLATSMEWLRKGYTPDNLHEVMPGYMKSEEVNKLYVKSIMAPHASIKGDDGQTNTFCLTSFEEFYKLGAAVSEARNDSLRDKPTFKYSVRVIDENFDYVQTRRDKRLSEIGIK
jgi:hypothetical protein